MTEPNACLVALATAWGPRHGGINAFNVEWVRSLGIAARRAYRLVCVVPAADAADQADAERHHVTLLPLGLDAAELPDSKADAVLALLRATPGLDIGHGTVVWLGHDDKTGPLALALREALADSRVVLVNHMAYGAYQDGKKDGVGVAQKQAAQQALFEQADQCLAVGPMLAGHLSGNLSLAKRAAVTMLVPGLAEPDVSQVPISDQPPENFAAFLGGRLGSDDERIKQALLGVRGFGRAIRRAKRRTKANANHALRRSPSLRMRGVPAEQHGDVRQVLEAEAGGIVTCDLQPYTEDRQRYFSDLARSSVALMPSWHEGFGLVAWEAIACQVPVVIGEQSGVYRLLHGEEQGAGLGRSVRAVAVEGLRAEAGEPPHTESDVDEVAKAVFELGTHLADAKTDAVILAQRLRRSYSWKDCADTTLQALQVHLGLPPLQPTPPTDEPASGDDGSKPVRPRSPTPDGNGRGTGTPAAPGGTPTFLRPPVPQAAAHTQLGPSALLAARDQVVRFHPARDAFVDGLLAAAAAPGLPRLTLQGVHGSGGAGKTRSALELLQRAEKVGWTGLWLPAELPEGALEAWKTLLSSHPRPLLLVVDYAEGRQPELLRWLRAALDDALPRSDAPRVHLLCLSRATDWWQALPRQPGCDDELAGLITGGRAHLGLAAVPDWPDAPADRAQAFNAALEDYAAALGQPQPDYPWRPDFSAPDYARPLYLHLAALAALAGERPGHGTALLAAQLRREWQHWQRSAPSVLASAGSWDDWADALALLALVQGLDATALSTALAQLGVSQPADFAAALSRAYPRDGGGAGALTPDLLAEHLIRERLGAEYAPLLLAQAFAPQDEVRLTQSLEVLARVWPRAWPDATADASLERGAQHVVDALAAVWLDNGNLLVAAVHQHGLALRAPVTASWRALPVEVQVAIAPALNLPNYSTPLLGLSVDIKRRILDAVADEPRRAGALNNLSVALADLGDVTSRTEALQIGRQAVESYRTLAEAQPAAYLHDLAMSLNNLANRLFQQGDAASRTETLRIGREAVQIRRTLSEAQPAIYLPYLALSLNNLASYLAAEGDAASRAEALRNSRESVQIRRTLVEAQPAIYLPDLAASLNNLVLRLAEQDDTALRAEALRIGREVVQIRRKLADAQPAAYLSKLAGSLNNLAADLSAESDAASRAEALRTAREAVQAYRTLAEAQPEAYLPDMASSLNTLANCLSAQGDAASRAEALRTAREVVQIRRSLAEAQPDAYLPNLAASLNNLANRLAEKDDATLRNEAVRAAREAVSIYSALFEQRPAAFERNLRIAEGTLARVTHLPEG